MTPHLVDNTEALLDRARNGEAAAVDELFRRHRDRLQRMIGIHLDRRLAARVDPSDVVQDTLIEASRRLEAFVCERPMLFYPWLRKLAWDRIVQLHRHHLRAQRRSVRQEVRALAVVSDASTVELVKHLAARGESPSKVLQASEERERVGRAVRLLSAPDREVLTLRFVEQLTTQEAAAVLGISPNAFAQRQLRAIKRLRALLAATETDSDESERD